MRKILVCLVLAFGLGVAMNAKPVAAQPGDCHLTTALNVQLGWANTWCGTGNQAHDQDMAYVLCWHGPGTSQARYDGPWVPVGYYTPYPGGSPVPYQSHVACPADGSTSASGGLLTRTV